ncbi:MAG TPA: TusE/DsrC/DsvC family sulfur relay protein [Anaeromyxobacteraceae bacterium]|nr:TusE/DsrC/DsvC family sulfur relay protein [Anaeromyxobacteraceae bacterium]
MPVLVNGSAVELNEDGFLAEFSSWNEEVARALAAEDGIPELTADHWKLIHYLRDYYQRFAIAPMIRKLCKDTGIGQQQILKLFPAGPAKGACKVAGLPKPTGCL